MNIYISGSLAYDRIMDFPGRFSDHILPDKIHILNVCFTVNGMAEKFGGTAGNIAYSLSLLREEPLILATIGKDYKNYFKWLKQNRIPTKGIRIIREEFTSGAFITTDKSDNQITGFNAGAMKYPSTFNFRKVDTARSIALLAAGNLQDMANYATVYRQKGIPFVCDPGQSLTAWEGTALKEWIDGSSILITNDYELELVMKITGIAKRGLLNLTKTIITTLGDKGSVVSTPDADVQVPPAKAKEVVDPTGAGDAYRAGLIKGLVMGKGMETAARMGSVCAAYAVEQYGTQEQRYTLEDFVRRYEENFGSQV